jgi:xanthine dehydrogenase small subunit
LRDHIRLLVNGREHRIAGATAFTTLANYLRYDAGATGTKIVCEEGDCGACSVLVRRGDGDFVAINSCIIALCQLDAASIVTVEGLKRGGELHPVQQAMVECHGAQCGYCTPGFVVTMSGLFERCDRVGEAQVRDGLTGNLCRCTGYEPIVKAALSVDGASMPKLRDLYPQAIDDGEAVRVGDFFAPTTLADAITFKREHPGCVIVQGSTDVGVWINKRNFAAPAMLFLGKVRELDELRGDDGAVVAGANVTLTAFERFLEGRIPELEAILHVFGSPQIKNTGTLIGNVANGSPIGDTLPYLFVSGAELELNGGARTVAIQDFYLGYKKFDLRPDEIITRIRVPVVRDRLKLYKVSRRRDLDISAFTAAIRLRTLDGHIDTAAIAYGGVAPTVVRLPRTEAFLAGKPVALDTFEEAGRIARGEVAPISDVRGSAEYRAQLAENILPKFWYETFA